MKLVLVLIIALLFLSCCYGQQAKQLVWASDAYSLYRDSLVQQNKFVAKAISDTEISSTYKSPVNQFKSSNITFKFGINGKDNEMKSGIDHHFNCLAVTGPCETPLIKFGTQVNTSDAGSKYLAANSTWKVRLDMREVLSAFKNKGYYTTFNGDKIYKEDFQGVYIAGNTAPLTWDFDNLAKHKDLELKDPDEDGIYEISLILNSTEEEDKQTASHWKLSKDIAAFPQYASAFTLTNALYNLGLEEMIKAIEPDSTFRTGKEWAGVWTRDISYSIILSMAYLQPQVAKYSLLKKVSSKKKIIQDTGTGGAWPVSTDRMIWAVAAWEVYKATGDNDWLKEAYLIIKNSVEDDLSTVYDVNTGLVKGESSFLDWREQTYPKWMQPVDIFESQNLGTNAVHFQANTVLSKMAGLLGYKEAALKYAKIAGNIKNAINKFLWQPGKKYYGQYLYGKINKILSPRAEALGEALCVLFDIAGKEKQKWIVANTPVTTFGISCIYPQIPSIPPYHNNAVWPFVQSFWLWAAAKTGNEKAVLESMAAIYRPAALFLTNKENFVADDGDFLGTQINSSNMLWSLAGNISIVHKVLFGIHINDDELVFTPFVPKALKDKRSLTNFKYRDAILDIEMEGYGNTINSFSIDGKVVKKAAIPAGLKGIHTIKIILAGDPFQASSINKVANYFSLPVPELYQEESFISWKKIPGASRYKIIKDGKIFRVIADSSIVIDKKQLSEYSVIAIDKNGIESFASEPVIVTNEKNTKQYEAESFMNKANYNYKGFSGEGFIETSTSVNTVIKIPVSIADDGIYLVDCKYANGNGPVNTENKCAIRTVKDGSKVIGVFVFPQRGSNEWSNWGFSNNLRVFLTKGDHELAIEYLPSNENMNIHVNQAMIDYLRIIKTRLPL